MYSKFFNGTVGAAELFRAGCNKSAVPVHMSLPHALDDVSVDGASRIKKKAGGPW